MTYSIGEFAEIVGVATSMVRYYESEDLLRPHRNKNNLREFNDGDIGWFLFLLHLKSSGMSIEELKQYTKWRSMGDETIPERMDLLEKRKELVEKEMKTLQKSLDVLNSKIVYYKDQLKGKKYKFEFSPKDH